jgi:hypothetical protein
MKALSDKGIQFRTFPVVPRKRIKFHEDTPVVVKEFGSGDEVFKCQGGYFTHNTYRLLDFFVSYWFEIASRNWMQNHGSKYPNKFSWSNIENLAALTPLLKNGYEDSARLLSDLIEVCQALRDYIIIDEISDSEMRKHPSLRGISSLNLLNIIDKSSNTKLKIIHPLRMIKGGSKQKHLGWSNLSNLDDTAPWSKLFDYRLIVERKGNDGRVLERIYKFGFSSPLGIAMIHNTICGGFWSVNPKLYEVSGDAQLLYRYLVITGSRWKNNSVEYIGHRLGWREKQKSRLCSRVKPLFEELCAAGLMKSYTLSRGRRNSGMFSFELEKKRSSKKKIKGHLKDQV